MTTQTTMQTLINKLLKMEAVFDERVSNKRQIMDRLTHIFNDDKKLATTVYDYCVQGHLAYHSQLRERFKPCQRKQ